MSAEPPAQAPQSTERDAYLQALIRRGSPAFRELLDEITDLQLDDRTLATLRAREVPQVPASGAVERLDLTAPGEWPVPVRLYREAGAADRPRPALISIHGGGYVIGSHLSDDARFEQWVPRFHCVAISVGYRLAPEDPYPRPLEDCYAVLRWAFENASELGIDPARIGITGYSAGGGLAAGLTLLARDRGEVPVAFQALVYPMLDDRLTGPSSRANAPSWTPPANQYGWQQYLGGLGDDIPGHAVPARAGDLSGLPPSFVTVGSLDGLMDEGIAYARRLIGAGVPTELHVFPEAVHGYDFRMPDLPAVRRATRAIEDWLENHMDPSAAE